MLGDSHKEVYTLKTVVIGSFVVGGAVTTTL